MRILVFSDSHKDIDSCARVIRNLIGIDMVLHAGDHISDAKELCRMFPEIPFEYVRGNNDFCRDDSDIVVEAEGKRIFLTHGDGYSVKYDDTFEELYKKAEKLNCDCVVFGHTHKSLCDPRRKILLLNPGSIKQSGTYGVIEIENGVLKAAICNI